MTTVGILGAGQAGSALATALLGIGHEVVIANSRNPATLKSLVEDLGPGARAAWAKDAAAAADLAILAFPHAPHDLLPVAELAGKIVLDTNNYMPWRDGHYPEVDAGRSTVHELRQRMLPDSKIVKAFTHIQFHPRPQIRDDRDLIPALFRLARPRAAEDRIALVVSSNHRDASEVVARIYDELGFDAVDNSPLSDSWRSAPGTPMWMESVDGQSRAALVRNLLLAER